MQDNKTVLTKAIQKAIDGGWLQNVPLPLTMKYVTIGTGDELDSICDDLMVRIYDETCNVENIIFNHDFAKALWGEEDDIETAEITDMFEGDPSYKFIEAWQYHLQQLVIADDPIEYLGQNI